MPGSRGARVAAVVVAGGLAAMIVSCTAVLGVDAEFHDAALAMCQCQDFLATLGTDTAGCRRGIEDKLAAATPEQQAHWMASFDAHACEACTTPILDRYRCLLDRPVCGELGTACDSPFACCDYLSYDSPTPKSACLRDPIGGGRTCQACVPEGGACTTNDECCGYPIAVTAEGYDAPYCIAGICGREPAACKHSNEHCDSDADCCGYESGRATCSGSKTCHEECDPDDPGNCPGCCGQVSGGFFVYEFECLDGPDDVAKCASLCNPNDPNACGDGQSCEPSCSIKTLRCITRCGG